jgi:hypothetical protein
MKMDKGMVSRERTEIELSNTRRGQVYICKCSILWNVVEQNAT